MKQGPSPKELFEALLRKTATFGGFLGFPIRARSISCFERLRVKRGPSSKDRNLRSASGESSSQRKQGFSCFPKTIVAVCDKKTLYVYDVFPFQRVCRSCIAFRYHGDPCKKPCILSPFSYSCIL